MPARYGDEVDGGAMRCPRCLGLWDPDFVDLGAENAECRPCGVVVALLGVVVPEWRGDVAASRLDVVGRAPSLRDIGVGESVSPRAIEARGLGSFLRTAPRLSLDQSGAREKRVFAKAVRVPLAEVLRVVPAVRFEWQRDARQQEKALVATSLVYVVAKGDTSELAPTLEVGSWNAARYVAARFEAVRRALTETSPYR